MSQGGPLAGLRVIDFTWAAMGPYAGYLLAGLGAEVIQVSRPLKATANSTTASITRFFDVGKTCIRVNVKELRGKKILHDLIDKSDIFLENFRPGVIEGLGFDFETLSQTNKNLVMISGSALGRGGQESGYVGYAPIFSALSGLADLTGFEDGRPTEIRYPCDLTSGALMAFAAIAGVANLKRREGSYVDLAARDALLWTLTSSFALSGKAINHRKGNNHETIFPHGVYRCAGEDQWVTIAARDNRQRQALFQLIGYTAGHGVDTGSLSNQDREAVESAIAAWAFSLDTEKAVATLQSQGVSAFASVDAKDIWQDKHLRCRHFFQYTTDVGWVASPPWFLQGGREAISHNGDASLAREKVFSGILGINSEAIEALLIEGVLG